MAKEETSKTLNNVLYDASLHMKMDTQDQTTNLFFFK